MIKYFVKETYGIILAQFEYVVLDSHKQEESSRQEVDLDYKISKLLSMCPTSSRKVPVLKFLQSFKREPPAAQPWAKYSSTKPLGGYLKLKLQLWNSNPISSC